MIEESFYITIVRGFRCSLVKKRLPGQINKAGQWSSSPLSVESREPGVTLRGIGIGQDDDFSVTLSLAADKHCRTEAGQNDHQSPRLVRDDVIKGCRVNHSRYDALPNAEKMDSQSYQRPGFGWGVGITIDFKPVRRINRGSGFSIFFSLEWV